MSVQRLLANVWSFVLTLVHSLLALFSFRRRAFDPFSLPSVNRTPDDALARAHSRLRPILLTPRSITLGQGARTRSVASTLVLRNTDERAGSASVPQASDSQRTSPKLDPHDAELGLSVTPFEYTGHPAAASATSFRECTPDTSGTGSLYVLPLTPPDRCYLAPLPSATDCPYTEPWPTCVPLDRSKPRFSASPLKVSININSAFPEPMVAPIGSPPPRRWSPTQIWTSTPCKEDSPKPNMALGPFDHHDDPSALVDVSQALISRSHNSIRPYDDASNSSASSYADPLVDLAETRPGLTRERYRTQALVPRSKNQVYPRFHHPNPYACTWRRHGARLPGKSGRAHSHSHVDLPGGEWYDANAYAPSPIVALSPPRCESATEDEDEDEIPLGRLRERLARQSARAGTSFGLDAPIGVGAHKASGMSPSTRRMSEGCLLAMSESTPTRIGVGAHSGRQALSMVLDGDGYGAKDWLEALSLRFSSEQKDTPESDMVVPTVNVAAG